GDRGDPRRASQHRVDAAAPRPAGLPDGPGACPGRRGRGPAPMRRFVEQAFSERSLEADAAELMRAAGPTPDAPAVKQRVRKRLVQAPARRRPRFVLALASVLAALALGTAAAATVGARWWRAA